jgi:small-conductance mechanosensitive channel
MADGLRTRQLGTIVPSSGSRAWCTGYYSVVYRLLQLGVQAITAWCTGYYSLVYRLLQLGVQAITAWCTGYYSLVYRLLQLGV